MAKNNERARYAGSEPNERQLSCSGDGEADNTLGVAIQTVIGDRPTLSSSD